MVQVKEELELAEETHIPLISLPTADEDGQKLMDEDFDITASSMCPLQPHHSDSGFIEEERAINAPSEVPAQLSHPPTADLGGTAAAKLKLRT